MLEGTSPPSLPHPLDGTHWSQKSIGLIPQFQFPALSEMKPVDYLPGFFFQRNGV